MNLPSKLEAILFVAGDPVEEDHLISVLNIHAQDLDRALDDLQARYVRSESGLRVLRSPEGIQLVTAPEAHPILETFLTASMRERLTPAAAETLGIVAYRGPISRAGVEAIRGVNSSFTLRLLALRGLVTREPHPTDRRSFVYRVSAEFLRFLGVLRLEDLPDYAELHAHRGMTTLVDQAEGTASVPLSSSADSAEKPSASAQHIQS